VRGEGVAALEPGRPSGQSCFRHGDRVLVREGREVLWVRQIHTRQKANVACVAMHETW
jgi:hypothetical protein